MDLDACKAPKKLRQAKAADGRAETADTFDSRIFKDKAGADARQHQLKCTISTPFQMAGKPMNLYKNPCRIL